MEIWVYKHLCCSVWRHKEGGFINACVCKCVVLYVTKGTEYKLLKCCVFNYPKPGHSHVFPLRNRNISCAFPDLKTSP